MIPFVGISPPVAALPFVFVAAPLKLIDRGLWAGCDSANAGIALNLVGLTTLLQA
jgi:hypothetical protein